MPKAKYQLEDFLAIVDDDYNDFVITVHEMLLQERYKLKVQLTKSYGLHIAYSQPQIKTVKGIIVYFLVRDGKLMIRINADNLDSYSDLLGRLPSSIICQIDRANDCMKKLDSQRCWHGCIGYDFNISGKRYLKCIVNCFLLDVDAESFPFLIEMLGSEVKERNVMV